MLIAYYRDPSNFPGWPSPKPHLGIFNQFDWNNNQIIFVQQDGKKRVSRWDESWFWPALVGLAEIGYPVMAHFALAAGEVGPGGYYFPPRVWLQITTLPLHEWREMNVEILWKPNPAADDAYKNLMNGSVSAEIHTALFWAEYFTQKLLEKRALAEIALNETMQETKRFHRILASIPQPVKGV